VCVNHYKDGQRADGRLFNLAFGLVSVFDSQKSAPHGKARAAEVQRMTCELRCLRAWARLMAVKTLSATTAASLGVARGNLFQELRSLLLQRFQRGEVASWFRSLFFSTQPKPKFSAEQEDGAYLVFDEGLGWIVRLETNATPCSCDGCQSLLLTFPAKSCHFNYPDM